ncbi:MAG: sigma-70 family RNA polymerase sigma factor [Aeromicrobium sp.]
MSNFVDVRGREQAFERVWRDEMPRILTYAARHVGSSDAHDVVAETFTIAWRRWDDITDPPIAWLLGVARNVVSNHVRSLQRRRRLQDRVRFLTAVTGRSGENLDLATRLEALRRLAALGETEREALLLTAWDGLTTEEAASVLGISPVAVRKRVSRARAAIGTDEKEREETP